MLRRLALALLLLASTLRAADPPAYLSAKDDSYAWKVVQEPELNGITAAVISMTSQTWRGIPWTHWMGIFRAKNCAHPQDALLVVDGGSIRKDPPERISKEWLYLAALAERTGSTVAIVGQVPNEPLFDGLKEDALIAYTFDHFLDDGDESWPCLLPMVKSAMRAMDTVQAFSEERFHTQVTRFVVAGASKRGWTTWLTGATDPRVVAIAPLVIDTLNIPEQMRLQVRSFGTFSEEIGDYTKIDLPKRIASENGKRLLQMVDPYSYLDKYTMPKLIVLGTNDRYWPVDAVKLYFPDLPGEKYIHYVPNAGHGLGPGALEAVSAFYQTMLTGEQRPRFAWKTSREGGELRVVVTAEDQPVRVKTWTAQSKDRDFRDDTWTGAEVAEADGAWTGTLKLPVGSFSAIFVELTYESSLGIEYTLTTNIEVAGDPE